MKETDLFKPVKILFEQMGYTVQGEVKDIDMIALLDETIIMVEFKLQLGFKLILQAINRQKLTEFVYVAIPKPKSTVIRSKSFKEKIHLLRRLELGLIYVTLEEDYSYAQIIEEPKPYNRNTSLSRNKKKKAAVLKEISNRHNDYNIGGSKGKVVTAYKEQALLIAYHLKDHQYAPAQLKEITGISKAGSILQKNFYGWYERVSKGQYTLTRAGQEAITQGQQLIDLINESKPHYN